jgi:hypothetical protein
MSGFKPTTVFDELYQRPEEVRYWLTTGSGKAFLRAMRDWKVQYEKQLKEENEPREVWRAQGAVKVLERILQLREEIEDVMGSKGPRETTTGAQRPNA